MRLYMQFQKITSVLFLSLGLVAMAHAGVDGGSSNPSNIAIGTAQAGADAPEHHQGGTAALSVVSAGTPYNGYLGFSALQGLANAFTGSGTSNTNSTVSVTGADDLHLKVSSIPVTAMPGSHSVLGNFNFAQVLETSGNQGSLPATYFGEWWGSADTVTGSTHTVYYAGDNTGRTVPTSGTAVYTVSGINGNSNALKGTFDVNFNTEEITAGSLTGGTGSTKSITIANVGFDASSGLISSSNFGGTVTGTNQANSTIGSGTLNGHFFGAGASTLGAVATFTDKQYDTAIGGVKN
jgi:hypothetical protein